MTGASVAAGTTGVGKGLRGGADGCFSTVDSGSLGGGAVGHGCIGDSHDEGDGSREVVGDAGDESG